MSDHADGVWIFSGAKKHFPGGVFTQRGLAESWISKHRLSGTLTLYPLDVGAYEWRLRRGCFVRESLTSLSLSSLADFPMPGWNTITTKMASGKTIDR